MMRLRSEQPMERARRLAREARARARREQTVRPPPLGKALREAAEMQLAVDREGLRRIEAGESLL